MDQKNIRNFLIIAHIDHGKSTLADRLLEVTKTVDPRKMREQFLDQMDLERERGITIKMQPVRMEYKGSSGEYIFNLIDTPGHVDFGYEVSRSLAAVEGAILLVDATKGIQAQTVSNAELAILQGLKIIPVINKIDLPQARTKEISQELAAFLEIDEKEVSSVSAKTGEGVAELLNRIPTEIEAPAGKETDNFRALIFDSRYDSFRGVIIYIRVVDGAIKKGDKISFVASKARGEALELGTFHPELVPCNDLGAGEIGYIVTGLKDPMLCRVGDTIKLNINTVKVEPLPGYLEPQPVVFASFFPNNADAFPSLADALNKFKLNDAALTFDVTSSDALGRGFRCGFLGTLHMEITLERLHREYGLTLVATLPTVKITAKLKNGKTFTVITPKELPSPETVEGLYEPWAKIEILSLPEDLPSVMRLVQETRAQVDEIKTIASTRVVLKAQVPLIDIIVDFADRLKSVSRGYASITWEPFGEKLGDLVRMDILVAGSEVEAFSRILPKDRAEREGRVMVGRLKEYLPRQLFSVPIQAAIGGNIIARETLSALRKDVTGYLYGGDYTRKRKLLEKQKKGKKKLKAMGKVDIPQETFLALLKRGD